MLKFIIGIIFLIILYCQVINNAKSNLANLEQEIIIASHNNNKNNINNNFNNKNNNKKNIYTKNISKLSLFKILNYLKLNIKNYNMQQQKKSIINQVTEELWNIKFVSNYDNLYNFLLLLLDQNLNISVKNFIIKTNNTLTQQKLLAAEFSIAYVYL